MLHRCVAFTVAIAGASVIGAHVSSVPGVQVRDVAFTGGGLADSPLGDGTALVMGPTGFPVPPQSYLDAADALYLRPHGFGGTTQALFTPEGLYPATGVKSSTLDASFAQGAQILDAAIRNQIAGGQVDATNPAVVFGWSQSAGVAGLAMQQLDDQGVPSDDVHFVLIGDPNNPNGGLLERFDVPAGANPSVPSLGVTFNGATPADLYPTDIYTNEYDGFADFPQYPLNVLSDVNAALGLIFSHITYVNLEPGQIADAIELPTSAADTLTNYYMIPADNLPLLDPLRFIPVIGNPLADLLQPDLRVLVNLGYGSINDGWSPGDADVPTPFGLFPTNLNPIDVLIALVNRMPEGIGAAIKDLLNPDNYRIIPFLLNNPLLTQLVDVLHTMGLTDATNPASLMNLPSLLELSRTVLSEFAHFPVSDVTLLSSPTDIINDVTGTIAADYATLLAVADTMTALDVTLPAYDAGIFVDQLQAGDLLGAICDPIAADLVLIPFAIAIGAATPVEEALGGTLMNLVDLIPGI